MLPELPPPPCCKGCSNGIESDFTPQICIGILRIPAVHVPVCRRSVPLLPWVSMATLQGWRPRPDQGWMPHASSRVCLDVAAGTQDAQDGGPGRNSSSWSRTRPLHRCCPAKGHREGGCCFLLHQSSSVSPDADPEDAGHLHQCLGAALHSLWAWEKSAAWQCSK